MAGRCALSSVIGRPFCESTEVLCMSLANGPDQTLSSLTADWAEMRRLEMELLIGLTVFMVGLALETWLARHSRRREDEELYESRLARYAGLHR
jgi:hypothetical protein